TGAFGHTRRNVIGPASFDAGPIDVRGLESEASAELQPLAALGDGDGHRVAVADLAGEQLLGELVADGLLDEPAQRPGPVGGVVAARGQPGPGVVGDLQGEPACGEPVAELAE